MPTIRFTVHGDLPPKKDGANSMWNKPTEARRLVALRKAAAQAMGGRTPLRDGIRLHLRVALAPHQIRSAGDLDNFITGVCDGLQAAHGRAQLHGIWSDPALAEALPRIADALEDDAGIESILTEKVEGIWQSHLVRGGPRGGAVMARKSLLTKPRVRPTILSQHCWPIRMGHHLRG